MRYRNKLFILYHSYYIVLCLVQPSVAMVVLLETLLHILSTFPGLYILQEISTYTLFQFVVYQI